MNISKANFSTTTPLDIKQTRRKWRCKEQYLRDRSRAVPEVSFEIRLGMISMTTSNGNRLLVRKTINFLKREAFCVTLVNILISHDVPVMAVFHANTMLIQTARNARRHRCNDICPRVRRVFFPLSMGSSHARTKKELRASTIEYFCNKAAI